MKGRTFAVVLVGLALGGSALRAQEKGPCPVAPPSLKPTEPDIFSDQQEQWLGEAQAESVESHMGLRFAPAAENAYLQAMGERMLAVLPPTGIHFQFRLYESGELNAFGIAGGRIYVSRKVIASLQSEDELAGMLAHEIGHILAHQDAIETTAMLREWLGVKQVGDRADILAQMHAIDRASDKKAHWHPPSEEHNQDVADQVAVYAMMRAGFQPRAYATAFDRITANKGKTGSGLADFFGMTTEDSRRYRADLKMAALIPEHCMGEAHRDPAAFSAWQKLVSEQSVKREETADATRVLKLEDPLRSNLRMIRYSPDGKYLIAQDYATIFVLQRNPLKVLFTIPVERSMNPKFTPDSSKVVLLTADLRVEHWDVATQKRVYVKEMILPEGCDYQELSPDGNVLACELIYIDKSDWPAESVALWSVDKNEVIFQKPHFALSGPGQYWMAMELINAKYRGLIPGDFSFSPDSNWFVAGLMGEQVVYYLPDSKKVSGEKGIGSLRGRSFAFVGNDKVATVVAGGGGEVVSFPDGKSLKSFPMGAQGINAVTKGEFAVLSPIKDYAVGLMDLTAGKLIAASKYKSMDVYGDEAATQTPRGGVQINLLNGGKVLASIELPESRLGEMEDAKITADGKYLLVSTPERSAVWYLPDGKRIGLMRPYSRASILPGDVAYFDFTKQDDKPRTQGTVDLMKATGADASVKLPEKGLLMGDMYVLPKPDNPSKPHKNATFEFYDLTTGKLMWSRRFQHAVPTLYREPSREQIGMWWEMSDGNDREEIDADPALRRAMEATGRARDGMVLQMVEAKTGKVVDTIAVTEHKPKGARDVRELLAFGDFLLVKGESGNTVIYRMSDKTRIGEVYGRAVAGDVASGLLAMTNRRNEVFLLDAATATEQARYTLGSDVRMASFPPGKNELLVLSAEQKLYTFSTTAKTSPASSASAKP